MVKIEGAHVGLLVWRKVPVEVVLSDMQEATGRLVLVTGISDDIRTLSAYLD